jgi:hypothetical protein
MRTSLLITCCILLTGPIISQETLYGLRSAGYDQSLVRVHSETGESEEVAAFFFTAPTRYVFGGLNLTGERGTLVLQGPAFHEFDEHSGILLRRYAALDPPYHTWSFHGVRVGEAAAARLGMPAGYYGGVSCPPGPDPTGEVCEVPSTPFPGYASRSNLSEQHVLLHRGLDPGATELSLVRLFAPSTSPWAVRRTAFDDMEGRFWFWVQEHTAEGSYKEQLRAADVVGSEVTNETPARQQATDAMVTRGFAFKPQTAVFFRTTLGIDAASERQLVRHDATGPEELVSRLTGQVWYPVLANIASSSPVQHVQIIPAIGETAGAHGTFWRSDLWLFNPSEEPITIQLRRNTTGDAREVTLGGRASVEIRNVLRELGGGEAGDGVTLDSLIIEAPYRSEQLVAYSRTYSGDESTGTYGQAVPAVPSRVGYSNHLPATVPLTAISETYSVLFLDKRDPGQFRHNFGMVNTGDSAVTIRLRYGVLSANAPLNPDVDRFLTIAPHANLQVNLESLFGEQIISIRPPIIWVSGNSPAVVYLSIVDNRSGDASFIPFTSFGVESHGTHTVPAIIHAAGGHGTFWRTDAYGIFQYRVDDRDAQEPLVTFRPADTQCESRTMSLVPSPGVAGLDGRWRKEWYTVYADLGRQLCDASEVRGALEVQTGSWTSMFTRTYTNRPDGGTYGDILPLYPPRGWPARHFAGIAVNQAFRINVGLYNGGESEGRWRLRLLASDGTLAAERTLSLSAHESIQNSLREAFDADIPEGLYGLSIDTLSGDGVWPWVSVVDNLTGDPTNFW